MPKWRLSIPEPTSRRMNGSQPASTQFLGETMWSYIAMPSHRRCNHCAAGRPRLKLGEIDRLSIFRKRNCKWIFGLGFLLFLLEDSQLLLCFDRIIQAVEGLI